METIRLFCIIAAVLMIGSLTDEAAFGDETLDFKDLKKAKEEIGGNEVTIIAGLGELGSGSFELEDEGITSDEYTAVKLYRPGKTKECINAYLQNDSTVMNMYKNYGSGEWLQRTCDEDKAVGVSGTLYYIGGKDYPVAMVIDDMQANRQRPQGNLRYSISVTSFENKSGWAGQWNVGDGFTEIMTNGLKQSDWFIVLGDTEMRQDAMAEQDFAASGRTAQGKKAPKIGRMTPAQLLVKGAVTHVQNTTTGGAGGINIQGIQLGGAKDTAEINITIYLVDSETGQVKASKSVIGKSKREGGGIGYFGGGLNGVTGGVSGHKVDNLGKACEDAVNQAIDFLIKQLDDIPWQGSVAMVKDDKIIINRGEREGVEVGMKFSVGSTEELVDEDTGEVLDVELTQVGVIEVAEVKEKIAYCQALEGGESIEKGMSIMPID
ncbi:MAG: CsgG/HfaB family protein [Phycisphaerae bacterium]|jgi:curli biogenesis system outer membrane secretion channel CsgG